MNGFGVFPLVPAYGRDYKGVKAAQADFDANKDFTCAFGSYTNKKDLRAMGHRGQIECRSANKRLVFMLQM